ncbi:class I SAM-dependent methyltransferase [Rugamonas sp.]|uniref:class I SAM-dependent methyltransferase n=1 Tax=Rugamonas sp. TaxID=1926287 RepID=UPI0025F19949|nr:class I SAM-dependent methyltransferase [Rugamonas sp.]
MIMMMTAILFLLLMLLGVALYLAHKVRRVHLMMYDLGNNIVQENAGLYRQIEALRGLELELDLKKSLPALRGWAASPDFLLEIVRHALDEKPRTVVECSSGTSTLVLARCMQLNGGGKVYSLEHDPAYARQTRENLVRMGLSDYAEVLDAPLRPLELDGARWSWYQHGVLPAGLPIDLLVIDGPPMNTGSLARYPAGPALFGQLSASGAVFLDDAARAEETAILARWKLEFPQLEQGSRYCEKGCAVLRVPRQGGSVHGGSV